MLLNYLKLIRVHQWSKNLFVFAPVFFGFGLFNFRLVIFSSIGFLSFCLMSSSVYILNDILDIASDRNHPEKKNRPIASGQIKVLNAVVLSMVLSLAGFIIAYMLSAKCLWILILYALTNIGYSLRLKHISIIDIFCIATGFVFRIFMGSFATGIHLSHWIIVMTFLLALFLALGKRRDDVKLFNNGNNVRKSIDGYNLRLIDSALIINASVIIVAYLLYCLSGDVQKYFKTDSLYITTLFVLLGIMRYLQLIYVFNMGGSPTIILIKDRFMQLTILSWIFAFTLVLYVHKPI